MVFPVVVATGRAEGRGVFDCVHIACGRACAGEDVPQTITEGVTVHVCLSSGALAAVLIYVTCPEVPHLQSSKEFKEKQK